MNKTLLETIKKLSQTESFKDVCTNRGNTDLSFNRSFTGNCATGAFHIVSGIFWRCCCKQGNHAYHIGVNVDKLMLLLTMQIKAGICFHSRIESNTCSDLDKVAQQKAVDFINMLPDIREKLHTDVIAAYNGDPAAKSFGEVIFCYPSIRAISNYRIAHALLKWIFRLFRVSLPKWRIPKRYRYSSRGNHW
jgi:serine O-acetyltransferase